MSIHKDLRQLHAHLYAHWCASDCRCVGSLQARAGQVQRIRSLFVRQLAVPHASAARTAAQYAAWEGAVAGKEGEEAEATAAAAVGATGGEAGPTGGVPDGVPDAEVLSCLPKAVQVSFEKAVAAMGKRKDLEERIRGLQGRGEEDAGEAPQLDAEAQAGLSQAYHVSATGPAWSVCLCTMRMSQAHMCFPLHRRICSRRTMWV